MVELCLSQEDFNLVLESLRDTSQTIMQTIQLNENAIISLDDSLAVNDFQDGIDDVMRKLQTYRQNNLELTQLYQQYQQLLDKLIIE